MVPPPTTEGTMRTGSSDRVDEWSKQGPTHRAVPLQLSIQSEDGD